MTRLVALLPILAACGGEPDADCGAATQKVADCYGDEAAAAFAQACTADLAKAALAETCASSDEGKGDLFSTPVLSPATEQFKYGSIGADMIGTPVAILRAIPLVCADTLPPGADPRHQPYASFGLIYEQNHDLPIGFSTRKLPIIGMQLAGTTCSQCHTATVRETPSSPRVAYFGAPNTRFDVQKFNEYLLGCIQDTRRFNPTTLDKAFRDLGVTGIDRFLAFSPAFLRAFTANLKAKIDSIVSDGPWGPGRDDAIALSAAILLGDEFLPTEPAPIDYPSVWNQQLRHGHSLHWDGAAGSALERNVLVSVGAGTPRSAVPLESIDAIQRFLDQLPPPKYPFAIDQTLAARGEPIWRANCASCHATDGSATRLFDVVALDEIGTDPNRVDVVTQAGIDKLNTFSGNGWQFSNFRKTNGYLSSPLDGIWLRAPYLHNGSVPTLRDLLKPGSQRPTMFFRGNDTYDQVNVGYVSTVPSEGATTFMTFDTSRAGNSSAGHEYGTQLSQDDQDALLEYLKTL
jgi:processive rubber oxygenase RoxA-like protein